jgi:predicted enzyme related to lactoylglutathione lyase
MMMPPMQVDAGRFSVISDPQGAVLSIIQLAQ